MNGINNRVILHLPLVVVLELCEEVVDEKSTTLVRFSIFIVNMTYRFTISSICGI